MEAAATLAERQHAGEVAWYTFEGITMRLAGNTFYWPDFAVMLTSGALQMHEVKGSGPTTEGRRSRSLLTSTQCAPLPYERGLRRKAAAGQSKNFRQTSHLRTVTEALWTK